MEFDNVRVAQILQHLQLIVDHLLIAFHVFLENDLDRDLLAVNVRFSDNAICACA